MTPIRTPPPHRRFRVSATLLAALLAASLAACGQGGADAAADAYRETLTGLAVPPQLLDGEALFDLHCASCHGEKALGTGQGPALVHTVYQPRHHADFSFQMAVRQGVRAHHWGFGDMPPLPGLTQEEVAEITAYVRWLQREVGIE